MNDRRMLTVNLAAAKLGRSPRTVRRWIHDTTEEQVHRERVWLPDERGRLVRTLSVDLNGLRRYAASLLDS